MSAKDEEQWRERLKWIRHSGDAVKMLELSLRTFREASWEACRDFGARRGATFYHGDRIHFEEAMNEALKDFFLRQHAREVS